MSRSDATGRPVLRVVAIVLIVLGSLILAAGVLALWGGGEESAGWASLVLFIPGAGLVLVGSLLLRRSRPLPGRPSTMSRGRMCPQCGGQVGDDWRVCGYCGTPLLPYTPATPHTPATWTCPACGGQARLEWDLCPQCGQPKTPVLAEKERAKRRARRIRLAGWVIFWLGVALMFILLAVVLPVGACVPSLQDRPATEFAIGLFVSIGVMVVGMLLISWRDFLAGMLGSALLGSTDDEGWDGDGDGDGD